jgi:hypothetical protein
LYQEAVSASRFDELLMGRYVQTVQTFQTAAAAPQQSKNVMLM